MTNTMEPQDDDFGPTLAAADRTGRVGVAYMRTICSQAGVGCSETAPGEDALAIDLKVEFPEGDVRVQIKAGTAQPLKDNSISVSVNDAWIRKWSRNRMPAYMVYVRLPGQEFEKLIEHGADFTKMHAHAYWTRIDKVSESPVRLLPSQRLTMDTLREWRAAIMELFAPRQEAEDE